MGENLWLPVRKTEGECVQDFDFCLSHSVPVLALNPWSCLWDRGREGSLPWLGLNSLLLAEKLQDS